MAREIVIWCDVHMGRRDERVPSVEHTITVDGRTRTLALCPEDEDEYLLPLMELLAEYGQKAAPQRHPGTPVRRPHHATGKTVEERAAEGVRRGRPTNHDEVVQCFYCTLTYSLKSRSTGISRHFKAHGYSSRAYVLGDIPCPVCGWHESKMIGQHLSRTHADLGLRSVEEAVWWAADNDDPHGAYADVMNREPDLANGAPAVEQPTLTQVEPADENARRKGVEPKGGRPLPCLLCGTAFAGSGGGYRIHLEQEHGIKRADLLGRICPICADEHEGTAALRMHIRRAHPELELPNVESALVWARDHGDPHGAYEAAMKRGQPGR